MNRDDRREMRLRAVSRLKKAKAWVLVTLQDSAPPIYQFDISSLKDEHALSTQAMQNIAHEAAEVCEFVFAEGVKAAEEAEVNEKVAEFKRNRSEELNVGRTFGDE